MFSITDELIKMFSGKKYRGKKRLRNGDDLYNSKDDYFIDESIVILDELQYGHKNYKSIANRVLLIKRRRF